MGQSFSGNLPPTKATVAFRVDVIWFVLYVIVTARLTTSKRTESIYRLMGTVRRRAKACDPGEKLLTRFTLPKLRGSRKHSDGFDSRRTCGEGACRERDFFIDNLLVQIFLIIVMIWWTGLAPWEFEFPFPGSLTSTHMRRIIDNLMVRIHFIIVMIWWAGLAPCEFEFPCPGSLSSTFLVRFFVLPSIVSTLMRRRSLLGPGFTCCFRSVVKFFRCL